jgi:plastocyanin
LRLRTTSRTGSARTQWGWSGVAVLIVAAALGLAACGGDDDETDTAADSAGDSAGYGGAAGGTGGGGGGGGESVDITATDFKFDPSDPTVKAGQVTFDLTNDGDSLHNIEIEGPSGEAVLPENIGPGEKGSVTADLNEPGTYEFYCPVGNHRDLGMVGEVTVE